MNDLAAKRTGVCHRQAMPVTTRRTHAFGLDPAKVRGLAASCVKVLVNALLLAVLLCPSSLPAAEAPVSSPEPEGFLKKMDRSHDILSEQLSALAGRIDLFMGGLRVCEDSKETYVQVGGNVIIRKDGEVRFDHVLRANIVLPNTQDRFRLLFESAAERDLQPVSPGSRRATETESLSQVSSDITNLKAALQYATQEKQKWHFSADAGAEVQLPPDPFGRLRLKRSFSLGDEFRLNFAETIFWFTSEGPGAKTQIDLEKHLFSSMLFRSTTEALWRERERGVDLGQNLSLFHELSWREVVVYKIGLTAQTEPYRHLKDWGVGIEYRRRLYKNWLYLSIQPALTFSRDNQYQTDPSINIGFDVTFGEKYVSPEKAEQR